MENGKITESKITDASGLTESREFPELRKEKQSISLFGSQSGFYVLKNGKLYTYVNDKTGLTLLADDVQSAAGGLDCCVYINKKGKAIFLNNGKKTDILDSLSNIKYVVSDGKENFYLIDSSGQVYAFYTRANRRRKVFEKEIVSFEDYTQTISSANSDNIQFIKRKNWDEIWLMNTSFYKDAVKQYGKENIGFKIYESSQKILKQAPLLDAIISVSFSIFTVRYESISPIVRSEEKIYIPEEDTAVYVDNGMYTDASDTELFINCPVKKVVYIAGETAAERYSAFSSVRVVVNTLTKKPRIINKGLMLQEDGTLQVFESSSHSWKNISFPIKNIFDIALFGTDNEYVAVSKTNGEIIITQYSTLLKYELGSFISIIRTP